MKRICQRTAFLAFTLALLLASNSMAHNETHAQELTIGWKSEPTPADVSLRGVFVVDDKVVFVSGAEGSIFRSDNEGETWKRLHVSDSEAFDFRDVHAFDRDHIVLMVAGSPARMYHSEDGGINWQVSIEDKREGAFFDAIDFWDSSNGLAFGDPINGKATLAKTNNGGRKWELLPTPELPTLASTEHGYAASGTCLATFGDQHAILALGGVPDQDTRQVADALENSRVLITRDGGKTWQSSDSRLPGSASAGIFSATWIDKDHLIAVGGDYTKEEVRDGSASFSTDGGKTWQAVEPSQLPSGYRSAVTAWPNSRDSDLFDRNKETAYDIVVCTGPNGSDYSLDGGRSWHRMAGEGYHACSFSPDGSLGWAVGSNGRFGRFYATQKQ